MARRGRFGRLPAAAPDLTSTIVSIAREMQNQEDSNIMNAWQNGGLFQGKPATDQVLLAYWENRMGHLDKGDPLYDNAQQEVYQLQYSIAESKNNVLNKQGKLSDAGMAQFFLNWAKKVNPNTQFYRTLQTDAAQFLQSAKTKGVAASNAAANKAYVASQDALMARTGKAADYLTSVITNIAIGRGLINPGQTLGNFDPTDPGALLSILGQINGHGGGSQGVGESRAAETGQTDATVLYSADAQGNFGGNVPVTVGQVRDFLTKNEPGWNGNISISDLQAFNTRKEQGFQVALKAAQKHGDATLVGKLQTAIGNLTESNRQLGIFSVEQSWKSLNDVFTTRLNSQPPPTPDQLGAIGATYYAGLSKLLGTPGLDENTKARIQGEIDGNPDMSNLGEDWAGTGPENPKGASVVGSNAETARALALAQEQQTAVASGQAIWSSGTLDPQTGLFAPSVNGTEIGAVNPALVPGGVPAMIEQGPGLPALPVYVPTAPMTITAVDQHGFPISTGGSTDAQVGSVAYIQGQPMFRITLGDGSVVWQASPPGQGANGVNFSIDPKTGAANLKVTLPQVDTSNAGGASDPSIGLTVTPPQQTGGKAGYSIDGSVLSTGIDAALYGAGVNNATQSPSITVARLLNQPGGQQTIAKLSQDTTWMQHVLAEATDATKGAPNAQAQVWQFIQNLDPTSQPPAFNPPANPMPRASQAGGNGAALTAGNRGTLPSGYGQEAQPLSAGPNNVAAAVAAQYASLHPNGGMAVPNPKTGLVPQGAINPAFQALSGAFDPNGKLYKGTAEHFQGDHPGAAIKTVGAITVPAVPGVHPVPGVNPGATTGGATGVNVPGVGGVMSGQQSGSGTTGYTPGGV